MSAAPLAPALRSTPGFGPPARLGPAMLQRKCKCGAHTPGGGGCGSCGGGRGRVQRKLSIGASDDPFEREADHVADRVLSARSPIGLAAPVGIQRLAAHPAGRAEAPASVDRVLGGSGRPLDPATRGDMEQRFGHDFSQVRVHADAAAGASAKEMDAKAYTVGNDIVFGAGHFAPASASGRQLLAHELTHVVQQSGAGTRVQKKDANALDDKAKAIIAAAQDATKPIAARAIAAVKAILSAYYDASMVSEVVYNEKETGLVTAAAGQGQAIKGKITVGKYFVDNIAKFARRVVQVGHELQHIQQHRDGMGGPKNRNEREFLAHSWASRQDEKPGTGRLAHATRVLMIDEALGNYYCLNDEKQKKYTAEKDGLLTLRASEETASNTAHTDPPTACTDPPAAAKSAPPAAAPNAPVVPRADPPVAAPNAPAAPKSEPPTAAPSPVAPKSEPPAGTTAPPATKSEPPTVGPVAPLAPEREPSAAGPGASAAPARKAEGPQEAAEKQVTIKPESQKVEGEKAKKKVEVEASLGGDVETSIDGRKLHTEAGGEFAVETSFPLHRNRNGGALTLFDQGSAEISFGASNVGGQLVLNMVKYEVPKLPAWFTQRQGEFNLTGQAIAGADLHLPDRSAGYKAGFSAGAEIKVNPFKKNESFFLKVSGTVAETYGMEDGGRWDWGPVTFSIGAAVGFTFPRVRKTRKAGKRRSKQK
jgi:hypothetical protein